MRWMLFGSTLGACAALQVLGRFAGSTLVLRSTTHVPPTWGERFNATIVWTWCFRISQRAPGTSRVHLRVRGRMSPLWFAALGGEPCAVPCGRATTGAGGYGRGMSEKTRTDISVRVLIHALDQAGDVLDRVHADDLLKPTPCDEWSVAALVDHLVATPARFLARMRGEEPDWSAEPPHLEHGWGPEFRNHADDLVHAWHELREAPATPAEWQVAELAVHTWDLATAIGLSVEGLDPEVAETALEFMRASLRPESRGHAFGAEQPAPPDAGPYAQLAAFAGRATG